MNLPQSVINQAAAIIKQHYGFNKLPGNDEVYHTIQCLRLEVGDKQTNLLKAKLLSLGIVV